jgi:tRNA-intron endonuclease
MILLQKLPTTFKNSYSKIYSMVKAKKKTAKEAAKSETPGSKASGVPEAKPQRTSSAKRKKTEKKESSENKSKKPVVTGILTGERVITENSDDAREFYNQSRFGTIIENGKVELSLLEGLYLMERGRLLVKSQAGRKLSFETYVKKARKVEPNFWIRYVVLKDMRNRGYIIKTALKFGADFRVYDRGVKPGEDHARWIVYPVHEGTTLTWHEWAAKNRVAHSTKKRLLIAVVDGEGDVSYWEARWLRP